MCGIAGVYAYGSGEPVSEAVLAAMCERIRHRGPDEGGTFVDGALGLGIRRLRIIDLVTGGQPVANEDGTVTAVYNGEIYNYQQLRRELTAAGHRFRSSGDTETLVHLYEDDGLSLVNRLRGMFAFALWDRPRRTLVLARDRIGIKPLYYADSGGRLTFASEIKALLCCPWIERRLDLEALDDYLTYKYVPGPRTMFQGIHKLPPVSLLVCSPAGVRVSRYWDPPSAPVPRLSEREWEESLEAELREAVRLHLISDVPLGVFLSGGLDSSTILALMREVGADPIRAFTIGFDLPGYDETPYARNVAKWFGAEHETFVVSASDVTSSVLNDLVAQLDEPLADDAAVATHYLSRMSRRSVTVALSGAGGDEVFGGYPHYWGDAVGEWLDGLPATARRGLARLGRALPARQQRRSGLRKLARFLEYVDQPPERRHVHYVTQLNFSETRKQALVAAAGRTSRAPGKALDTAARYFADGDGDFLNRAMRVDLQTYLVDDVLMMTDKMSMWNSLEVRVPLLDHKLVEHMLSAPSALKVTPGKLKVLLRRVVARRLPPELLARPKHGFAVPIVVWLLDRLQAFFAEALLDPGAACRTYFRAAEIERLLAEHRNGRADHSHRLWQLLVFELWHRAMLAPRPTPADA